MTAGCGPAQTAAEKPGPVSDGGTMGCAEVYTHEEKLIRAAQDGSLDAFECLVLRYQSSVVSTAYHLLGDETEADDVAQEVWIRVFRSLRRFRFKSRFYTWLYRITVNQALSALRRRGRRLGTRRQDVELDAPETELNLQSKAPGPRRILEGKEMAREFQRALNALPEKQRLAVILVLFQDLSHREAGQAMGVAEKTVSWHLFKARARLMKELKEHLK
ncbi:sigma-70 family RNA polymerase sigma factor [Candidatus Sumerlaeota bacterium]|nr:sigma-70 family RNA polymerase sigma factor [Candidatus Sumerlaeota bacterium]